MADKEGTTGKCSKCEFPITVYQGSYRHDDLGDDAACGTHPTPR